MAKVKDSPGEAAWALRYAFDGIMDGSTIAKAAAATEAEAASSRGGKGELTVLDFQTGMPAGGPRWYSMDDVVMGGVSSSTIKWDSKAGSAVFQGAGVWQSMDSGSDGIWGSFLYSVICSNTSLTES